MADLIDRGKLIDYIMESYPDWCVKPVRPIFDFISGMPSVDAVEVVRCKGCKHQEKYFYADKRLKDGGRYSYGCDLAEGYSHVCLDDDFCSRGEQKDG